MVCVFLPGMIQSDIIVVAVYYNTIEYTTLLLFSSFHCTLSNNQRTLLLSFSMNTLKDG